MEMPVGGIILPIYPLIFTTIAGVGVGMILGYGMPVGAGEALAGDGTILGDGTAGAGEASVGVGMPVGAGEALAGDGTTGAGEAMVGAGTMAFTIEMLLSIELEGDTRITPWPAMRCEEDPT